MPRELPPAPTRPLFHLFNAQSGDHFVTTDTAVASQYEGRGYRGSVIARVYTYAETHTKAIGTNHGTAFIFASRAPQTRPSSTVLPLWYMSNNAGDFFYTTSAAQAHEPGWTAALVGFVGTP